MRDLFHHRGRTLSVALTLAAAVLALVLVVPMASAGSPGGKNEVRFYVNEKGQKTKKVGEDELFGIVGKNLNHAVEVYCWAGDWVPVTFWDYSASGSSKLLIDVDAAYECSGTSEGRIAVEFDTVSAVPGTPGNAFIVGPRIAIKAGDPDV